MVRVMRIVVPERAIPRSAAGSRNIRRLPSGSSAKVISSNGGDHPHQIAG